MTSRVEAAQVRSCTDHELRGRLGDLKREERALRRDALAESDHELPNRARVCTDLDHRGKVEVEVRHEPPSGDLVGFLAQHRSR